MKIVVTGASSQIGAFLIPKLIAENHQCYFVSRLLNSDANNTNWIKADLNGQYDFFSALRPLDAWIHIAPLPLANAWLEKAAQAGIKRFIGFSTTSIYTKINSPDPYDRRFVADICAAEQYIKNFCESSAIAWTVFRPTLIYGCGRDRNVAFIEKMIKSFGFFPVVGEARGLRQPVHAEDLANACLSALQTERTENKSYNLSGGEILTYREMVERIFLSQNKSPRILKISAPLLKLIVRLMALWPSWRHITPAMVDRINQDMIFEHTGACRDFDYSPRLFLQNNDISASNHT